MNSHHMTALSTALAQAGQPFTGDLIPSEWLRYGDKRGQYHYWLIYYELSGGHLAGAFGNWRTGEKHKFLSWDNGADTSKYDAATLQREYEQRQRQAEARQAKRHAEAAKLAADMLENMPDHGQSIYLKQKGVKGYGVHYGNDCHGQFIAVPVRTIDGKLTGLHRIYDKPVNGKNKLFLPGTQKRGAFHQIGDIAGEIVLCEGFATAASIYGATGKTVLVCFDAGNMKPVAEAIRAKYPDATIIVAADNDQYKDTGNTGVTKATEAAKLIGAKLAIPQFTDTSSKPTDFNDMAALSGNEAVKDLIEQAAMCASDGEIQGIFKVSGKGVYWMEARDKDEDEDEAEPIEHWICSRLDIVAATRDTDSENHGRLLEFTDIHGIKHHWPMPMRMLAGGASASEYREILLDKGLAIAPGRKARDRLSEYLQVWHVRSKALCVDRIGWHSGRYVLPTQTIGENGERVLLQTGISDYPGYGAAGTLDEWRREVAALCIGNSRLAFAVSVAFASCLLDITGDENGGFHFRGSSSTGKTITTLLACSVHGGPERLQTWRATANGLEAIASQHNDSMLALDEIAQVDPRAAGEVAYMLANGQGKHRARRDGGARRIHRWRLLFLSNGEISLADHMQSVGKRAKAGQETRLVDIPADAGKGLGIFDSVPLSPEISQYAKSAQWISAKYYGTAGPEFIGRIAADLAGAAEKIQADRQAFIDEHVPGDADGQTRRVASRFALVAAAGELATKYGITGWRAGESEQAAARCFHDWLQARGGVGQLEVREALQQVRRFFEMHGESRFSPWHCSECNGTGTVGGYMCTACNGADKTERPRTINRVGFRKTTDGDLEYFVMIEAFKHEVCSGLDWRQVGNWLVDRGWLMPGSDGRATRKERLPGMKQTARCYRFTPKCMSETFTTSIKNVGTAGTAGTSNANAIKNNDLGYNDSVPTAKKLLGTAGTDPGTLGFVPAVPTAKKLLGTNSDTPEATIHAPSGDLSPLSPLSPAKTIRYCSACEYLTGEHCEFRNETRSPDHLACGEFKLFEL